jgi:hypothetical protein
MSEWRIVRTVGAMHNTTTYAKFTSVLLACGAVTFGLVACGSDGGPAEPAPPSPLVLDAIFDPGSSAQVDTGAKGESLGDYMVGAADLTRGGRPYGRVELVDYVLDKRYEGAMKLGSMFLPRGTLSLQGGGVNVPIPGAAGNRDEVLAVVGGTGAYGGAGGTVTVKPLSDGNARVTVRLQG